MICVAISEPGVTKCLHTLKKVQLAEIRLDLTGFGFDEIQKVFSHPTPTIATCRPDKTGAEVQYEKLKASIIAGANYVDIEIEAEKKQRDSLIQLAREHNCKVIVSYHNFNETPGMDELQSIVESCYACGADIAKIATLVREKADNIRLLSLYSIEKPLVVLGMGEPGKITRIMAPLLGAEFTFAAMDKGEPTAPGQIRYKSLKALLKQLMRELKT